MPGFDGTGPKSMGTMTGGGRGFCTNPRGAGRPFFGGFGFYGRGGGRGWRNQFYATGLPRWQRWAYWNAPPMAAGGKQALQSEADFLRSRLQDLEARLAEMNTEER